MRYYVTGANGFIGKHVVKYLQDRGHEVIPVKRILGISKIDVSKEFVFVHLGAYGNHYNQRGIIEMVNANILNLKFILDVCQSENCRKLYNISTSSIQLPKQTLYSTSKHFGELMVESCNDNRFVNVRPYSVYGPGEASHRFIPTVIRALRTGEELQLASDAFHDWIYIDDFVEALFNGYREIGSGQSISNGSIAEYLENISGRKLNWRYVNRMRGYDNVDWECKKGVPSRTIFEGLKLTYERTP